MALGTITKRTLGGERGMAPLFVERLNVVGDGAYATGGTAGFTAVVNAALAPRQVAVVDAFGWGITAGAISHYAIFDPVNDKLQVFTLAGAEAAGAANLSTTVFQLTVVGQ